MFQISIAPSRKTASALSVLAAMGASGMVAEVSSAADLNPTQAAFGTRSSYMGVDNSENWKNWLTENALTYHAGTNGPGFTAWPIDFSAGPILSAKYRIDANGTSFAYGIPAGTTLDFALVTEPWSPATPDPNRFGPDYGTTLGTDLVQVTAPGDDFDADITPLMLTWQANPTAYYGVRFYVSAGAERGGVQAPGVTGITGDLILEQAIPEPASLSLLAFAGLSALGRRPRK